MKYLIIALLFTTFATAQIQQDKIKHFAVGAIASATTYGYFKIKTPKRAFLYTVGVSAIMGLGKELIDEHNYGGFDHKDLMATILGGITATIIIKIVWKKNLKIQQK